LCHSVCHYPACLPACSCLLQPTWEETEPPTLSPTHSTRPTTVAVAVSSIEDDKPIKMNILYGAAALFVVGVAAVTYFQKRASHLIKDRHEVALEIADTNY
jgi:hypothetical protein